MAIYHLEAKTAQQRSLTNEKKQTPAWSLLRERESLTNEARTELKARLGADYSEKRLDYAEQDLRRLLAEEVRELRQYGRALQSAGYNVIARNNRKRSNDMVR